MNYTYIVRLESGVYLSGGDGDPPRTTDKSKAKKFTSIAKANKAIQDARAYRPFNKAEIIVWDWRYGL
jgi:hypothetical protein